MEGDRLRVRAMGLFVLSSVLAAAPLFAQAPARAEVIRHDRTGIAAVDVVSGPGAPGRGPGTDFTFIKESTSGTSPKFEVLDEFGTTWKVKLGEETRSETAATRLLWAAGYHVEMGYYLPQIQVRGLPRLDRGREFVSDGGIVTGARLERETGEDASTWSWYDNPFIGTREFNGLRVMMALINNWDLKEVNNSAPDDPESGGAYRITDLGATFGRTGNTFRRSKGVVQDYAEAPFVDKVTSTHVDFVIKSRPSFLTVFMLPNYRFRTRMESVAKQIPIADALWIGGRLGMLSAAQIEDVFRTAGFSPIEVEGYVKVVMRRIAELQTLDRTASAGSPESRPARTSAGGVDEVGTRCLESTCRQVPVRETLTAIGIGTPYARAIVGGFEQGAGIGGGVQVTTADAIPAVRLRAAALTSTARFRRFDLEAFFPHIRGSLNHADVWFSHVRRETAFFGIGPRTSSAFETDFATVERSYQGSFYRDLSPRLQGGVYAQVMSAQASRGSDAAVTPIDEIFSSTSEAPARWIPGFNAPPRVLSYGGFIAYDTRDNSVGLTRGLDLYGRVASADGVGDEPESERYGWVEQEVDVRGYAPLGSSRRSLLLRARAQFKTPKGGERQIPFHSLSWLGGRHYVRGYDSYRFRGNHVLLFASELQQTVYSMTSVRGLDGFVFGDTGQVWGDDRSSTDPEVLANQAFSSRNWHSGFGGGLQYRHSRSVAGRVEIARGSEGSEVYASLSRGF